MPPLLRSAYLTCWYCQTKSNLRRTPNLRQWHCKSCEAINYLDENGQITDPPVDSNQNTPTAPRDRYAHQPIRGRSPDLTPQQSSIFCRTCTQNHHFYTQALASYLPASTDPEYKTYLSKLDEYKVNLEKRYPQICAECAPKVNQRMRETNKAARDDHLRRKLQQSKVQRLVDWEKWGWKRIAVFAGGVAWSMSLLGQMEYHVMGMLPSAEVQDDAMYGTWFSTQRCVWDGLRTGESQHNCLHATQERVWGGFWLGLFSCWWNYKLAEALYSHARLRGVNNHMALQAMVLIVRAAAIWSLDQSWLRNSAIPLNAAHGVMLIFLMLTTITSLRSIRLIKAPLISFSGLKPILAAPSTTPKTVSYENTHVTSAFPISSLGRQHSPESTYTTSNYDNDETDDTISVTSSSMDWTPTESTELKQINLRRPVQPTFQSPYRHVGPSPFRGTLPPAPQAPAHKARNPRSMQPFIPASKEKQEMFAKRMVGEGQDGDFGGAKRGDYTLQQPTMRDREAESRETGLESLFNAAFSVSNKPLEVSQTPSQQEHEGFLPGIESSPPSSQNLLSRTPKRERVGHIYNGEVVRDTVPGVSILVYFLLALVVVGIGMIIRQGWGQWSEVGSFIWKVLNGNGTKAAQEKDPGGVKYPQHDLGGEYL